MRSERVRGTRATRNSSAKQKMLFTLNTMTNIYNWIIFCLCSLLNLRSGAEWTKHSACLVTFFCHSFRSPHNFALLLLKLEKKSSAAPDIPDMTQFHIALCFECSTRDKRVASSLFQSANNCWRQLKKITSKQLWATNDSSKMLKRSEERKKHHQFNQKF